MKSFNRIIALLIFGLLLAGCDSDSGSESDILNGTWEATLDGDQTYLEIDLPQIAVYVFNMELACYFTEQFTAERISGDMYEIEEPGGDVSPSTLRVEGNVLFIDEGEEEGVTLTRSSVDVDALSICLFATRPSSES